MKQIVTITGENLKVVANNVEVDAAGAGKKTKAQMRLEALKAAGVDVSKYFPLGDDKLIKIENGAAVPVDMDDATIDAVGKQIVEGGYVSNWKLFRRWVDESNVPHVARHGEGRQVIQRGVAAQGIRVSVAHVGERAVCSDEDVRPQGLRERQGEKSLV